MAWCRQATSHYLNQCWPRSMSPYGITSPHWVQQPPINQSQIIIHQLKNFTFNNCATKSSPFSLLTFLCRRPLLGVMCPPRCTTMAAACPVGQSLSTLTTSLWLISRTRIWLISTNKSPSWSVWHRPRSRICFTFWPWELSAIVKPKPIWPFTIFTVKNSGLLDSEISLPSSKLRFRRSSVMVKSWSDLLLREMFKCSESPCELLLILGVFVVLFMGWVTATVVTISVLGSLGSNGRLYPRHTSSTIRSPMLIPWNMLTTSWCVYPRTHWSPTYTNTSPGIASTYIIISYHHYHIDGLVQDCSNSNALAMELLQSCTKPSIYVCCCQFSCSGAGKRFSNWKESCLPLLNAGFEVRQSETPNICSDINSMKPQFCLVSS